MRVKTFLKSGNIWQSYKQERDCLMHFVRLANTRLKDGGSAWTWFLSMNKSLSRLMMFQNIWKVMRHGVKYVIYKY